MQKTVINGDLPHTAISTWSGFVYQGKIALYHCLKLISINMENIQQLRLKIENVDDFSIHRNEECLSLHQVKAYKESYFSTYKSAVEKQKKDSIKYPNAEAYFHVSTNISNIPLDFDTKYNPVKFYQYRKNDEIFSFCSLHEIDDLIESIIGEVYARTQQERNHKLTAEYLSRSRNLLEDLILKKIIYMHNRIQKTKGAADRIIASEEYIGFDSFFHILNCDITEALLNDDYFYGLLRQDIGRFYLEFYLEMDMNDGSNRNLEKLDSYVDAISQLDKDSLGAFIRAVLPHKKGEFHSISDYRTEVFTQDELKDGLFYIFDKLKKSSFNEGCSIPIFVWESETRNYYPTAICASQKSSSKMCQRIIEASIKNDVDFLYESGSLVTLDIDCDSIFDGIYVVPNLSYQQYEKINSFKKISLISVDNMPEEFKGE